MLAMHLIVHNVRDFDQTHGLRQDCSPVKFRDWHPFDHNNMQEDCRDEVNY
jgi:hypothetical protein